VLLPDSSDSYPHSLALKGEARALLVSLEKSQDVQEILTKEA
jgi:hypothetical protein